MRTFKFDKLVRDKIVDQQLQSGAKPDFRVLEKAEYLEALKAKILEEAGEMELSDKDELVKELADLQEVIDCMIQAIGSSTDELAQAQAKKNVKAGSFKKKLFVSSVSVPESDGWTDYYLANPDRYPEITTRGVDK